MPCCGQNRERAANAGTDYSAARVERPPQPQRTYTPVMAKATPGPMVTIHNKQRSLVEVQGPATGQRYRFEAGGMQAVDKRDAQHLLATGMFERVWG